MATIRDFLVKEEVGIQAYGTPEGASKGWDTRGRGRFKEIDDTNFAKGNKIKYADMSKVEMQGPEDTAKFLKDNGYNVHNSRWFDFGDHENDRDKMDNAIDKYVDRAHSKGRDVVHTDFGSGSGYMLHSVSLKK